MKLGLNLLQERARKGSFWWPYISNLPETYSVPIFFPGEDIKNLQYAPLLYQVLRGYGEYVFPSRNNISNLPALRLLFSHAHLLSIAIGPYKLGLIQMESLRHKQRKNYFVEN
uniref:Putative ovule protein n=1 Tax=Solanum chacoense TaxID=4108 RepID=A0A0V0HIM0_SOLCH